jgi:hypothetical protein
MLTSSNLKKQEGKFARLCNWSSQAVLDTRGIGLTKNKIREKMKANQHFVSCKPEAEMYLTVRDG